MGRLGDWETGRLGDWETGRLGDWETGSRILILFLVFPPFPVTERSRSTLPTSYSPLPTSHGRLITIST
ncbi:Long-chain-fatty-acid--CoA ligase [Crocosphaera watsonii WH 0402]|uniref:Long-chain-fatty-acid--CoA ligase n=2 Tax=Crocosphaera watsonii TaxID=263511 RepID=T2JP22_CROWT|nr:Long-chain-fatty-acid--CoA ligase [Crocosphaera watsonii WH 0005]CCQ66975.1 Long-chain-fatty-acid--CoA ligase [Crocosphaera watsonii WH 0402]